MKSITPIDNMKINFQFILFQLKFDNIFWIVVKVEYSRKQIEMV